MFHPQTAPLTAERSTGIAQRLDRFSPSRAPPSKGRSVRRERRIHSRRSHAAHTTNRQTQSISLSAAKNRNRKLEREEKKHEDIDGKQCCNPGGPQRIYLGEHQATRSVYRAGNRSLVPRAPGGAASWKFSFDLEAL